MVGLLCQSLMIRGVHDSSVTVKLQEQSTRASTSTRTNPICSIVYYKNIIRLQCTTTCTSIVNIVFFIAQQQQVLLLKLVLILLTNLPRVEGTFLPLNQRPIPYQVLDNGVYVRNLTNDQQFHGDTISDVLLFVLALIIPFLIQLTVSWKYGYPDDINYTIIVYILAFTLTAVVTELIKNYVGYLRPIFYDMCQPSNDYSTCTNDIRNINDGRKSFPSGHASAAFCGLTLLTLFLHNRFGVPSIITYTLVPSSSLTDTDDTDDVEQTIKVTYQKNPLKYRIYSILSLIPMSLALFIAASRIHDNRHFPADVVAGSILGGLISFFVHTVWWMD